MTYRLAAWSQPEQISYDSFLLGHLKIGVAFLILCELKLLLLFFKLFFVSISPDSCVTGWIEC